MSGLYKEVFGKSLPPFLGLEISRSISFVLALYVPHFFKKEIKIASSSLKQEAVTI
jgi:hypothetical protein